MKNLYSIITENRDVVQKLITLGVVPPSIVRYMAIYKFYLDFLSTGETKSLARESTLDHFKIGERYFYKVLRKMTSAPI